MNNGNGNGKKRIFIPRWNFNEWKKFIDTAGDNGDRGKDREGFISLLPRIEFLQMYREALLSRERFDEGFKKEDMLKYLDSAIKKETENLQKRYEAW